jgi:hypothetical protein
LISEDIDDTVDEAYGAPSAQISPEVSEFMQMMGLSVDWIRNAYLQTPSSGAQQALTQLTAAVQQYVTAAQAAQQAAQAFSELVKADQQKTAEYAKQGITYRG